MKGFHKKMTPMINENITTRLLVGIEINGQKAFNSSKSVQQPKKKKKKSLTVRTVKKVLTVFNSHLALVETSFRVKSE
jgi:hypothetical protein